MAVRAHKGAPELGYINKVEHRSVHARSMCAYNAAPLERHALLGQFFIQYGVAVELLESLLYNCRPRQEGAAKDSLRGVKGYICNGAISTRHWFRILAHSFSPLCYQIPSRYVLLVHIY